MASNGSLPRLVSACLAAGLTLVMLVAFLLPGPALERPSAPRASGTGTPVFAQIVGGPGAQAPQAPRRPRADPNPRDARRAALPQPAAGPAPERQAASPGTGGAPAAPVPQEASARSAAPANEAPAEPASGTRAGPAPADLAPRTARAASAALQLDRHVVREASRASRSAVQRLAEASGQPAGDAPKGADATLAESVARTVKPDCFPPGGSAGLLSPIVSAWLIATDQCRNR